MPITRRAALALPLLAPALARAAGYPDRPVRLIVPYAAGGNADVTARILAPPLTEQLGQPVVVENRAGAGGSVASLAVAKNTRPDGYTLMIGSNGPLSVNPSIQPSLGYDPMRDFAYIGLACRTPLTIVVRKGFPAQTLREFIAYARARPGQVSVGTSGVGGSGHLALASFNALTGLELQHVPYGGAGAAVPDLLAGNLDSGYIEISTSLPLHRAGQARILAIAAARRSALAPDIPTAEEQGVAGAREAAYLGIVLPAGPPAEAAERLGAALRHTLGLAETRRRFAEVGSEVAEAEEQTPAGFAQFVDAELARTKAAAVKAGLRPA